MGDVQAAEEAIRAALGRDFEVVQTTSGKYVVEYFNFNSAPPPLGDTRDEAVLLFEKFIGEKRENTDDRDNA